MKKPRTITIMPIRGLNIPIKQITIITEPIELKRARLIAEEGTKEHKNIINYTVK